MPVSRLSKLSAVLVGIVGVAQLARVEPEYFDVDVWAFERLLQEVPEDAGGKEALASAVQLYREDLLEGAYGEWIDPLRGAVPEPILGRAGSPRRGVLERRRRQRSQ